ncbi:MAG: hypothetical protein NC407_13395, partial [Lachnoclostridium sp.]|nr:hypothetical protein [Lachnoclostridium sp.]
MFDPNQGARIIHKDITDKDANLLDVIGIYPLLEDDTCRFIVFDFDNHEKGAEKYDFANKDDAWKEEVDALKEICILNGIDPLIEHSRSGRGAHVWIFFQQKISTKINKPLKNEGTEKLLLFSGSFLFFYIETALIFQFNLKHIKKLPVY